ncbi:MAG: DHH family phosphoesterase [Oscillospiraceae bacterium]|nr:DHH family phosphoesterase [Oscillospiraceae bacterium]
MTTLTKEQTSEFLSGHNHFSIITHCGPDGDTVGSAAALCLGLRQIGKTAHVLENPQVPEKYRYLLENLTKPDAQPGDTIVSVDVAAAQMLSEASRHLENQVDLRIDHHGSATPFAKYELVDSTAAACGEIVYDLITLLGATLDKNMANALYTAVSTDTGCFRYANTTGRSFALAAKCADASGDIMPIAQELFDTVTMGKLRVQSWILEHMHSLCDGKILVCGIPADLQEQLGITEEDMGNLSGFLRSIEGVKMAATVKQDKEGHTGFSVRAVPGYNAAAVCEKFGGGGHKGAAGASMENVTLDDAVAALIAAMPEI